MKLAKLFSKRSDGGIQEWSVEVEGSKFRVTSGITDGNLVTAAWTTCTGKNIGRANETTPEDQARTEAQAKWTKKKDGGYCESVAALSSVTLIEPMLAKKFEDYEGSLTYPCYTQPKLDGIRCLASEQGMFTRNGKPHAALPHIANALAPIFKKFPGLILDGEAYGSKLNKDFSRICSLVKRPKPSSAELAECAEHISYHVYDVIAGLPGASKLFNARADFIRHELANLIGIIPVETHLVSSRKELDGYYEDFLAAGHEGQMVRVNGLYERKRSSLLLKRKTFDDGEWKILGMEEGVGNRAGTCGAMHFQTAAGIHFKSNVKGTWEFVEDLWKNRKNYTDKLATIKYFGLTPGDKVPRFPYVINIRDGE